jgi:hypothetical protein
MKKIHAKPNSRVKQDWRKTIFQEINELLLVSSPYSPQVEKAF